MGNISELESEEKPRWLPLSQEMFPQDSLGYKIFPPILEGRKRPETIFDKPISSLWAKSSGLPSQLNARDLFTVGDVLKRSEIDLTVFVRFPELRDRLDFYMQGLVITPHGRLLAAIFGGKENSIPAEQEQEMIDAVNTILEDPQLKLKGKEGTVISLRFGLDDGITRKTEELTSYFKVGRERIGQIERKGLRRLRHPSRSKFLKGYLPLPEQSLARQEFGIVFQKDLPDVDGWFVDYDNLKDSTRLEILKGDINIASVFVGNQVPDLLSDQARSDITQEIRRAVEDRRVKEEEWAREMVERQRIAEESRLREAEKPKPPIVTKLLPEVPIDNTLYNNIKDADLPWFLRNKFRKEKRWYTTWGDLLVLSPAELAKIVSSQTQAAKIGRILQERLGHSPQSESDDIPSSLVKERANFEGQENQKKQISHMNAVRRVVNIAIEKGLTNPEDIQKFIVSQGGQREVLKVTPNSWVTLAMIEYILHHPELTQQ